VPEVKVQQETIEIAGTKYTVTHIPTATSGSWYVVHDACEIWGAVAIDFDGTTIGWKNPPTKFQAELEAAIKKAFAVPID
jgi:hypothetical protein